MDQLRRSRKHIDGSPRRQGSLRGRHPASEVAGAPPCRYRFEGWCSRYRGRVARFPRAILRQVAAPRRLRLPRRHSAHLRRQIQKNRPPRTIRQLELGVVEETTLDNLLLLNYLNRVTIVEY